MKTARLRIDITGVFHHVDRVVTFRGADVGKSDTVLRQLFEVARDLAFVGAVTDVELMTHRQVHLAAVEETVGYRLELAFDREDAIQKGLFHFHW